MHIVGRNSAISLVSRDYNTSLERSRDGGSTDMSLVFLSSEMAEIWALKVLVNYENPTCGSLGGWRLIAWTSHFKKKVDRSVPHACRKKIIYTVFTSGVDPPL